VEGLISVLIVSGVHVVEFPFNDEIFFFLVQGEEAFALMCCLLL